MKNANGTYKYRFMINISYLVKNNLAWKNGNNIFLIMNRKKDAVKMQQVLINHVWVWILTIIISIYNILKN